MVWYEWLKWKDGSGWNVERFPESWMSHQRCAGCPGRKAEFPCGLTGDVESRCCAFDLGVNRRNVTLPAP